MKITIEHDNSTKDIFQDVTDCYLAIRQVTKAMNEKKETAKIIETRSYSWGQNLRDIAKELYQSWVEIQETLKSLNKK